MQRRDVINVAVVALGLVAITAGAAAQQAPAAPPAAPRPPATIPPLLFREVWKTHLEGEPPVKDRAKYDAPDLAAQDVYRRVDQRAVTNPQLELKLYGEHSIDVQVISQQGRQDLWTGMAHGPVAILLRDKNNFINLTGLARLRAIVRTDSLHVLYPALKLADGTLIAGHRVITTEGNFVTTEVAYTGMRWYRVDQKSVTSNTGIPNPDLSKVDEVGFVDLMGGGGHGAPGGWSNISTVELYAKTVPR